jgi:hypothetical protein
LQKAEPYARAKNNNKNKIYVNKKIKEIYLMKDIFYNLIDRW